jgi:hypothetical protein
VQERCLVALTDVVINVKATYGSIEVLIADARAWDFFGSPTDLVGTSIQHRFSDPGASLAYMEAAQLATVGPALVKQLEVVIGEELVEINALAPTVEDSIILALTAMKGEQYFRLTS